MSGVWDPVRPELDRPRALDPATPAATYLVCSTPRSGSGLLCRGLASTGRGGVPAEYLNPRQRGPLAQRWGCGDSLPAYADALRAWRTDASGTFGLKVHWNQLTGISSMDDPLRSLFPGAVFVRIVRLDLTLQAVSLWRAMVSGVWSQRAGEPPRPAPPRYSYRGIRACRLDIAEQDAAWDRYFRRAAIVPVEVVYERLVAEYETEVRRVLAAVTGAEAGLAVAPPDSLPQGDADSLAMAARFDADRRRHGPRGPARVLRVLRRLR